MKQFKFRFKLILPLLPALIIYIGMLALITTLKNEIQNRTYLYVISLLPMIPATFLAYGILKILRKLDELEEKIILEAAAFSFLISVLGFVGLGLVQRAGLPIPDLLILALLMAIFLFIGKIRGNRKHK